MKLLQDILVYTLLGAFSGISEVLLISSSGNLVIFKTLFEKLGIVFPKTNMILEILVSTGSLIAILFYYRKTIKRLVYSVFSYIKEPSSRDKTLPDFRYCLLLIIAAIPTLIVGLLFHNYIELSFNNVKLVGCTLLITATFLLIIHIYGYKGKRSSRSINLWDALKIGLFQVIALLPGISRSGITITAGMLSGLSQRSARDFSFIMFIPISIAATLFKLGSFINNAQLGDLWLPYLFAFLFSIITTYLSLHILLKVLEKRKMNYLSIYCLIIAIVTLVIL